MKAARKIWKDKQVSQALGKISRMAPPNEVFDRVWFKMEERLERRKKPLGRALVWRPWRHPGGWLALAACLCLTLTGVGYQRTQVENNDLVSYLMSVSNPASQVTQDEGMVNVTILLTDPPAQADSSLPPDEDSSNLLKDDEILL